MVYCGITTDSRVFFIFRSESNQLATSSMFPRSRFGSKLMHEVLLHVHVSCFVCIIQKPASGSLCNLAIQLDLLFVLHLCIFLSSSVFDLVCLVSKILLLEGLIYRFHCQYGCNMQQNSLLLSVSILKLFSLFTFFAVGSSQKKKHKLCDTQQALSPKLTPSSWESLVERITESRKNCRKHRGFLLCSADCTFYAIRSIRGNTKLLFANTKPLLVKLRIISVQPKRLCPKKRL